MIRIFTGITILISLNKSLLYLIGDIWHRKGFPRTTIRITMQKEKKPDLSQEETEFNSIHSKKRIIVEHTISRLKKYRILANVFRHRLGKYDDIIYSYRSVNYQMMNHYCY